MKKLIGLTGPSAFTSECISTVEELLDANFVLLYHNNDQNVRDWLDKVDGVIIAGGVDVHPSIYSESIWNNQNLTKFDIRRDWRELAIVEYCIRNNKPLFGICRGHQLLGIKYGFSFVIDLAGSTVCHQPQKVGIMTSSNEPTHSVRLIQEELFYQLYKMPEVPPERMILKDVLHQKTPDRVWVNSFHHQALAYNPKKQYDKEGVVVMGIARIDLQQCKEIIEFMQGNSWISVQWHPEWDWRDNTVSRVILERFKKMLDGERNG